MNPDTFLTLDDIDSPPPASPPAAPLPVAAQAPTSTPTAPRFRRQFKVCSIDHVVADSEWDQMQVHLDATCAAWILRFGPNAVFNYMHLFGSGHYREYGKMRKNLAIYANQAFEAVQGRHQTFALHSTQRNGRIGRKKKKTDVMMDLIRLVQRKIGLKEIKKMEIKPKIFLRKEVPKWVRNTKRKKK